MRKCDITAEHCIHLFMLTHELFEKFQVNCLGYKTGDTECCNDVEKSFLKKICKKKSVLPKPVLSIKILSSLRAKLLVYIELSKEERGFYKIPFLFAAI